jgi:hypothetical protein
MFDISDEFDCFFKLDFNPLGEFVYGDQDMFVATWSGMKRSTVSRPHIAKGHDGGIVRRA